MRKTREIQIGNIRIGAGHPVAVQSMTNTQTKDVAATVQQILSMEAAGCDIVRSAVYDLECARLIPQIKRRIHIPFVADIHFDYRVAVEAIKNGADKVRINPGNIGGRERVREVVKAAKDYRVPIRVGGNTGSLPKDVAQEYGVSAKALFISAQRNIEMLEEMDFHDIVVSLKSSCVPVCVEAYRMMAEVSDYPLHVGITEAGTLQDASIKSAIGIGTLLMEGIGDTIRVSVTGDPLCEIPVAQKILKYCGKRQQGVEIISCPTCSRCTLDIEALADKLADYTADITKPLKIAVMGCAVNGPGEAKDADFGIAGGGGQGLIFEKGKTLKKVPEAELYAELIRLVDKYR